MKQSLIYTIALIAASVTTMAQAPDSSKIKDLKAVTITGQKPLIRQEVDRLVYDLQADPDSKGSNLLEIMRKVPYLSVDGSGNVLLKGNTSYKILINGKPSGMIEKDPSQILRNIPASTIQQIEVFTTPPSRYDGEGLTGIINIITIKRHTNGYNGTLNLSERLPANGPSTGASLAFKSGKLGISASGGASKYDLPHARNDMQRSTAGKQATYLSQEGDRNTSRRSGYLGTEISFEVDSLHLLTAQFNIDGNNSDGAAQLRSSLTDANTILQQYYLNSHDEGKGHGRDAGINYQISARKNKNNVLTFSYRYMAYGRDQRYQQMFTDTIQYNVPGYRQANNEDFREHAIQADYVRSFRKFNMEAGVKGIWRNNKSDFQYEYYQPASGKFEIDPASNGFNGDQNLFSIYNAYTFSTSKWDIKAGVRAEQTFTNASFDNDSLQLHQQFFNILPSLIINRKLNKNSALNLGFSQRLKRPNIYRLNPFTDRSNPAAQTSGNPALRPSVINNIQLSYNWSGKVAVTTAVSYAFVRNLFIELTSFDTAQYITRTTQQDNVKGGALEFDYNLNYPINKRLNVSINGHLSHISLNAQNDITLNTWINSVHATTSLRLDKGWKLNAGLSMTSRDRQSLQSSANAVTTSYLGFNKDLIKDKLSCTATINNPFTTYRYKRTALEDPLFTQYTNTQEYFRTLNMSVNYNFGKLKQGIKKNKRGIKNDDGN